MMIDPCSGGVKKSSIGVPCHGGDRVGMTKVLCNLFKRLEPGEIQLRSKEKMDCLEFLGWTTGS